MKEFLEDIKGFAIFLVTQILTGLEQLMVVISSYRYVNDFQAFSGMELDLEEKNDTAIKKCLESLLIKIPQIVFSVCICKPLWSYFGNESCLEILIVFFAVERALEKTFKDLLLVS